MTFINIYYFNQVESRLDLTIADISSFIVYTYISQGASKLQLQYIVSNSDSTITIVQFCAPRRDFIVFLPFIKKNHKNPQILWSIIF